MDLNKKNLKPTVKQALTKMTSYCSYQERCQKEVLEKLAQFDLDQNDRDEILLYLFKENFVNEERYAKAFARGKFRQNKWGKNKIKQHLKNKQISDFCIRKGLEEIDEENYIEVLKQLIEKKSHSIKDKNHFIRKKKIMDFVLSKGYEYEIIMSLL